MAVRRKLTLYLSPRNMLSCPRATSKRFRGAIRGGLWSSPSLFGTGICSKVDPNCDTEHGLGRGCVGVARCDPQNRPASNSSSALRGTPNESVIAIAGAPVEVTVV